MALEPTCRHPPSTPADTAQQPSQVQIPKTFNDVGVGSLIFSLPFPFCLADKLQPPSASVSSIESLSPSAFSTGYFCLLFLSGNVYLLPISYHLQCNSTTMSSISNSTLPSKPQDAASNSSVSADQKDLPGLLTANNDSSGLSGDEDASDNNVDSNLDTDPEALARVSSGPAYSTFSKSTKRWIVGMVTCAGFVSPMTANIYFPALNAIAADLGVTTGLINLTITSYMVFQAISPTIFGDFGDMAGRR